jgi:hypothetical protein
VSEAIKEYGLVIAALALVGLIVARPLARYLPPGCVLFFALAVLVGLVLVVVG